MLEPILQKNSSSAPVNQALTLDYTVLGSHATLKPDFRGTTSSPKQEHNNATPSLAALRRVVAAKQQLLHQQGDDEDWDPVAWTTLDSQALLRAVANATGALGPTQNPDASLDVAKAVVKAAAAAAAEPGSTTNSTTSWLEQLASLVLAVKACWEALPEQQKQADHAPLELVCSTGLLLVRLYANAAACASGACQQPAMQLLRTLCGSSVQRLLQEALAGYLFIFRWHEQSGAVADLDSVMLRKPLVHLSSNAPGQQPCSDGPCSASDSPASASSLTQQQQALPRLLGTEHVPAAHRAWCGSFQLPLLPCNAHWRSGQEVLIGWNNTCCRAEQLGLPVVIKPESFMLALEGLWLFAQAPGAYLQQHGGLAAAPGGAAVSGATSDAGHLQLLALWPTFLMRLLAHLEATAAPAVADRSQQQEVPAADSTESIQSGVIVPAAPMLLGMLGEALQLLGLKWQLEPAAARAALIRATIAESEQPVVMRQRRSAALIGKAKPKPGEVVCGQLLLMVKQLALLLTELLQLERSACGGPQRDGSVPVTESGAEAVWFSCLWRCWPRGCCQALELLLRCPVPPCEPTTTLQELLLDDLWECLKALPLLDDRETAKAVTAAVVSSQKLARRWQDATAAVLLHGTAAVSGSGFAGSAVASQGGSKEDERKKGSRKGAGKGDSSERAQQQAAGQRVSTIREAAGEEGGSKGDNPGVATLPAWLVAAAEADAQAALRAGLTLLYRLLDCAQKAYYWRWYTWWQQLQQQVDASELQRGAALSSSAASTGSGGSSVWSSSSSFLSSSSEGSLGDEDVNAAIEAAGSIGSSTSSCSAQLAAGTAARVATASAAAAQAAAVPATEASGSLWCDGAVQLAFGYTALAAPSFQFVDALVKRGFAGMTEAQRLQQQEALLGLLDSVSAGLASNSLILVEMHRLGLLPGFAPGAAAAVDRVQGCLAGMLSSALKAAAAATAVPAVSAGPGKRAAGNRAADKAASGSSRAVRAGRLAPPEPAASLKAYDDYWQGLGFEPVDQLRLSRTLAGLALQPVGVAAVGCHNPGCCNLAGTTERRLVTLACRACRQVAYCCRPCQAAHWKSEGYCHRAECNDLQEQQQAEWLPVESAEEDEESFEACQEGGCT